MKKVLIVGGDMRNVALANEFRKRGNPPLVCGIGKDYVSDSGKFTEEFQKALSESEIIILPLPVTKDGESINTPLYDGVLSLKDVSAYAPKDAFIFGGMTEKIKELGDFPYACDYAKRDDFATLNAVPTAEGAILEVMKILPITLFASNVIVTGFGRCARILALTLKNLGANVTVCARSLKDLSFAHSLGLKTIKLSEMHLYLPRADAIFNTVPKKIFGARELDAIRESTPFADIASYPGGLDCDEAKTRGINYLFLPALPGKYSPVTAGQIIYKTITNILETRQSD